MVISIWHYYIESIYLSMQLTNRCIVEPKLVNEIVEFRRDRNLKIGLLELMLMGKLREETKRD